MALAQGISMKVFKEWSYTVEIYWHARVFDGILGVQVVQTTPESNRTAQYRAREVFWLPGANTSSIFGYQEGRSLGRVCDVFSPAALSQPDVLSCIRQEFGPVLTYHAWVGYSMYHFTDDGYYCCDWYVQGPDHIHSGRYAHYLLKDVKAPSEYYHAKNLQYQGVYQMDDPNPGYQGLGPQGRVRALTRHVVP